MKTIKGPGIFLAQFIGDRPHLTPWKAWQNGRRSWAIRHYKSRVITSLCLMSNKQPEVRPIVMIFVGCWPGMGW